MVAEGPQSKNAFFLSPGQDPVEIGSPSITSTAAHAMNDVGSVVGNFNGEAASYRSHAFLWNQTNGLIDITPIPGGNAYADSINNAGQVLVNEIFLDGSSMSFLYDHGTFYDISTLLDSSANGWSYFILEGINNNGQIVGAGWYNNQNQAFLLNPTSASPITPAPEPTTAALLLCSTTLLLRPRRSRH
jgi:uncharacterized membrane protein